jgi:hypothetical protein
LLDPFDNVDFCIAIVIHKHVVGSRDWEAIVIKNALILGVTLGRDKFLTAGRTKRSIPAEFVEILAVFLAEGGVREETSG